MAGGQSGRSREALAIEPAVTLPVESHGRVIDILVIALDGSSFRRRAGVAEMLGERALAAARDGAPLTLYRDPLAWLRGWELYAASARRAAVDTVFLPHLQACVPAPAPAPAGALRPFRRVRRAALARAAALPGSHGLCVLEPEACDWARLLAGVGEVTVPDRNFRRWLAARLDRGRPGPGAFEPEAPAPEI